MIFGVWLPVTRATKAKLELARKFGLPNGSRRASASRWHPSSKVEHGSVGNRGLGPDYPTSSTACRSASARISLLRLNPRTARWPAAPIVAADFAAGRLKPYFPDFI